MAQASKDNASKEISEKEIAERINHIIQQTKLDTKIIKAMLDGIDLREVARYALLRLLKEHNMSAIAFVLKNNIR